MTRLGLPDTSDRAAYERLFRSPLWERAAVEICARHGVESQPLVRSPQGENVIFFAGSRAVVKIYAPSRDNFARESAALEFARGRLPIETPEVMHRGEIEGWPYLVMTRLPGEASREAWARVGRRDRSEIVSLLGAALGELHAHAPPLDDAALNRDWAGFLERQARGALERQRRCGASAEWLERLPGYVEERAGLLEEDGRQVFLHGDVHAGNLLLAEEGGRWRVKGLLDFGDSLCGAREYEFVAPGVLMVQGDGELQRAMLGAYGYTESRLDSALRARLMLLTVLYECSDLRKYARRLAPEAEGYTLDRLERAVWAFAAD